MFAIQPDGVSRICKEEWEKLLKKKAAKPVASH